MWHKDYGFPIRDKGMATCLEKFVEGKFFNLVSSKNGYAVSDCKNVKTRQVLEFVVPILYPEKPTRVTVTIGNTIFGALSGKREVDWALVIQNIVKRLLARVGKSKPTPICPYVFHLYYSHDAIRLDNKKVYLVRESMLKHNIESDQEDNSAGADAFEQKNLDAAEIVEL